MFHAQADAIVDDGRSAHNTALKHNNVPVSCGLQGAILEQASCHPGFFMGNAGRGIMAAGFDDQAVVPFIGDGCCSNRATGSGADHDHIGFFRDGIMADKCPGRKIPTGFTAHRSLPGSGAIALRGKFEIEIGVNRIVEILCFVARLPVAVIAGEDYALGPRYILKQVDPRVLQAPAYQIFPDPGWCEQKERPAQKEQQAVERHTDFIGFCTVDIGKMFLQIFDHLIGGNGHFSIVKQGLGHRLDHQRLQPIKWFPQILSPKVRPGV